MSETPNADTEVKSTTIDPLLDTISETTQNDPMKVVVCASCNHHLAYLQDAVEMFGNHEHVMTNPAGYVHAFKCFREALGCAVIGNPTQADSWFPGYIWRLAMCGNCETFLGWFFMGVNPFYGLLSQKIVELERDD